MFVVLTVSLWLAAAQAAGEGPESASIPCTHVGVLVECDVPAADAAPGLGTGTAASWQARAAHAALAATATPVVPCHLRRAPDRSLPCAPAAPHFRRFPLLI